MVLNLHTAINKKVLQNCIYKNHAAKPLSFITLTLSSKQNHTDKEVKRNMLDRFIVTLTRKGYLKQYIWKAEAQKNGNLHFHVITPNYIKKEVIRSTWNEIQFDNGYLDTYIHYHGHGNAPSTEIKACKNIRHTAGYVAKYISKKGDSRLIEGRLWGCSDRLRSLKTPTIIASNHIKDVLHKGVMSGEIQLKELEHCNIYIGDMYNFMANNSPELMQYYCAEVERNWKHCIEIKKEIVVNTNIIPILHSGKKETQLKLWQSN